MMLLNIIEDCAVMRNNCFSSPVQVSTLERRYTSDTFQINMSPFIYIPRISLIYLALQLFLNNVGFSLA